MPRSPSPGYRDERYRDDPLTRPFPPRGVDRGVEPPWAQRQRDHRGGQHEWARRRDDERDYGRRRSRSRSRDGHGGYHRGYETDRYNDSSSSSRSPVKPVASGSKSATPEEGQITSPERSERKSPLPPRRRSPSPPPRFREDHSRPGSSYGRPPHDSRPWSRDRSPDRDYDRPPRPYHRPRSRSPPIRRHRSPSPSSYSSNSRSSHFNSPRKRSPEKQPLPYRGPPPSINPQERRPLPFLGRAPPSGPRSERIGAIPTGPRALTGNPPPMPPSGPSAERQNPYAASASPIAGPSTSPSRPFRPQTPLIETDNLHEKAARSVPTPPSASGRLSWSERKNTPITETTPTKPVIASPKVETKPVLPPEPVPVPAQVAVKTEPGLVVPKEEIGPKSPIEAKPNLEDVRKAEADIAAFRARQEEMRMKAELPDIKIGYGIAAWEIDLSNHYKQMQALQQQTIRAQSAARIANAVLRDAEAERMAATERRKIAESQLAASTFGIGVGVLPTT